MSMVQAASVSIHGAHGQHIENIHLQEYQDEEDVYKNLYKPHYRKLFTRAEHFLRDTASEDVLVFIRYHLELLTTQGHLSNLLHSGQLWLRCK